jgi:predicted O-methyltransferase YrrM
MSLDKDIRDILFRVEDEIEGRMPRVANNLFLMMKAVANAGDGDHLEIGALFGGSAISVALLMEKLGRDDDVYAIDPLSGYYRERSKRTDNIDDTTGLAVTSHRVIKNLHHFGVEDRVKLIMRNSHPFPNELKNHYFSSAFIDGDHWGDAPLNDWNNVKDRVSKTVIFDNADKQYPAVLKACYFADLEPDWDITLHKNTTCVLGRRQDE